MGYLSTAACTTALDGARQTPAVSGKNKLKYCAPENHLHGRFSAMENNRRRPANDRINTASAENAPTADNRPRKQPDLIAAAEWNWRSGGGWREGEVDPRATP